MAETIKSDNVGIGDRTNCGFSSSLVTYGRGKGIVVATGMNTEVGKIAQMLDDVDESETPLKRRLSVLGKTLGVVAIIICILIFLVGLLVYDRPWIEMFMTAVSLAVAAIPEGLAAVSTIVLAIGVQRMVKRNAIVKKLPAVETLGSATVICSDKTGTLTQNKMTVKKVFWNSRLEDVEKAPMDNELQNLTYNAILCNDTKVLEDGSLAGDPTETALTEMAFGYKLDSSIYSDMPRVAEVPFDSDRKLMTTVHRINDNLYRVYTKGGVDELLKRCKGYSLNGNYREDLERYKQEIYKNNEEMARNALRVLAFGYRELDHKPNKEELEKIEGDLIFLGMVGMIDPPSSKM